jgi:hypothetical protein
MTVFAYFCPATKVGLRSKFQAVFSLCIVSPEVGKNDSMKFRETAQKIMVARRPDG